MKLRTILGIVFASPVTFVTLLFYILPFSLFGWYKYIGWRDTNNEASLLGTAPVWVVQLHRCPIWLVNLWNKWNGHCIGTAVVLKYAPGSSKKADITLVHELHHVDQMHRLGFFQPILYVLASLCAKLAGEDGYVMNVYEVAARRVAGQAIDFRVSSSKDVK